MTEPSEWKRPALGVLLAAIVLIACAEVSGASMVKFKLELTRGARALILARPAVHGLVGVRDVDEQIIDQAMAKIDGGYRLFHLHAEGMGLVIIATTMVVSTFVQLEGPRKALTALLAVGGFGYPFGYLLWSGLIPFYGVERGKDLAEWLVWIPFGSAVIVAMWWLTGILAVRLLRR
ncbi:MAG: hypothetical protein ACRDY4_07075 [Acidimicrobiia bacterium]